MDDQFISPQGGWRLQSHGVRAVVWRRSGATTGSDTVVLDIDPSLHEVHSEHKADAAPTYKGGYGFHPIYCFADATGECLAETLQPGNAAANAIADHTEVRWSMFRNGFVLVTRCPANTPLPFSPGMAVPGQWLGPLSIVRRLMPSKMRCVSPIFGISMVPISTSGSSA